MNVYDKIERLHNLFQQGSINEQDYEFKKQILLRKNALDISPKYQVVYTILALVYGSIGAHNYYIGRWKRGLVQTLISVLTLGLGVPITYLWAIINIFTIKTDAKNRLLVPSKPAKITCAILGILVCPIFLLMFVFPLVVGGLAGYTTAMGRYNANEILNFAALAKISMNSEENYLPVPCSEVIPDITLPKVGRCLVHPDGAVE